MIVNPGTTVNSLTVSRAGYLVNAGAKEITEIVAIADTGAKCSFAITTPGGNEVPSYEQGDYLFIKNVAGQKFAIWANVNGNNTEPTGALYQTADVKIRVDVSSSDDIPTTTAKFVSAIEPHLVEMELANVETELGTFSIVQTKMGVVDTPIDSRADDSALGTHSGIIETDGADSNYNSTYFTISACKARNPYYLYFDVNGEGVDPALERHNKVSLELNPSDTASAVATKLEAALETISGLSVSRDNDTVTVTNTSNENQPDASAGTSPLTVTVTQDGVDPTYGSSGSVSQLSSSPAAGDC